MKPTNRESWRSLPTYPGSRPRRALEDPAASGLEELREAQRFRSGCFHVSSRPREPSPHRFDFPLEHAREDLDRAIDIGARVCGGNEHGNHRVGRNANASGGHAARKSGVSLPIIAEGLGRIREGTPGKTTPTDEPKRSTERDDSKSDAIASSPRASRAPNESRWGASEGSLPRSKQSAAAARARGSGRRAPSLRIAWPRSKPRASRRTNTTPNGIPSESASPNINASGSTPRRQPAPRAPNRIPERPSSKTHQAPFSWDVAQSRARKSGEAAPDSSRAEAAPRSRTRSSLPRLRRRLRARRRRRNAGIVAHRSRAAIRGRG